MILVTEKNGQQQDDEQAIISFVIMSSALLRKLRLMKMPRIVIKPCKIIEVFPRSFKAVLEADLEFGFLNTIICHFLSAIEIYLVEVLEAIKLILEGISIIKSTFIVYLFGLSKKGNKLFWRLFGYDNITTYHLKYWLPACIQLW